MILDDEDILIGNVKKDLKLSELSRVLGKFYVTKNGLSGFILSLDENGLPSLIASIPTTSINYIDFIDRYCKGNEKWKEHWQVATKELLMKYISNWDIEGDAFSLPIGEIVSTSFSAVMNMNYDNIRGNWLYNILGAYWLGDIDDDFMHKVSFNAAEKSFNINFYKIAALLTSTATSAFAGVLLLHELSDDEKISIQESNDILDGRLMNFKIGNPLI
jgi:hypothetical protein